MARITKPAVAFRLEAMARASPPTGPARKRAQNAFAPEARPPGSAAVLIGPLRLGAGARVQRHGDEVHHQDGDQDRHRDEQEKGLH